MVRLAAHGRADARAEQAGTRTGARAHGHGHGRHGNGSTLHGNTLTRTQAHTRAHGRTWAHGLTGARTHTGRLARGSSTRVAVLLAEKRLLSSKNIPPVSYDGGYL